MNKESFNLNIEEMTQAGLQSGHRVSKLHPRMKPYIAGIKNTVHIIDLEKTIDKFSEALTLIKSLISEWKNLLIVGTKVPSKEIVKKAAEEAGLPYVNTRWLGGTFTNFETILKRIAHLKELEKEKSTGGLEKYTKKERMKIDEEIEALRIKFGGIKDMQKLPDAILILDMKKDGTAATEARKKGVKIIAICDSNIDPALIDYIIPANDDAVSSVKYILEKIKEVVLKARPQKND